jgi:hypothetical protein
MPSSKYTFNVILDKPDEQHLIALAEKLRVSRGAVVRRLIDAAYQHIIIEIPTCADGNRCYTPQMHTRPAAPTPAPNQP